MKSQIGIIHIPFYSDGTFAIIPRGVDVATKLLIEEQAKKIKIKGVKNGLSE